MTSDKKIILPGTDSPNSIVKVLEAVADQQRVATIIVRRGERFLMKVVEVRKEVLVGEVRCLNWSPDMGRRIYENFAEGRNVDDRNREVLLADAIDAFGSEAHRFRVYIPIDDITAVYEDLDDPFDETPFLPLP